MNALSLRPTAGRPAWMAAWALVAAPRLALAHSPGSMILALALLVLVAAAVRLAVERWLTAILWPLDGRGAGWGRLTALAVAEIALGFGAIGAAFSSGLFSALAVLAMAVVATTILRLLLLRPFLTWRRALAMSLVFPSVLTVLGLTTADLLYVLLGG